LPGVFRKKKTVGIRVPDNTIALAMVKELGNPIVSTSIKDDDELLEYTTDPSLMFDEWKHLVDVVIDGGFGGNEASTVIDLTGREPILIREGKGGVLVYALHHKVHRGFEVLAYRTVNYLTGELNSVVGAFLCALHKFINYQSI